MKLLDYIFYVLTHSGIKNPNDDEGARMFSCNILSLWLVFSAITILSMIGIIAENNISKMVRNPLYIVIFAGSIFAFIHIRYYKLEKYYRIVEWRKGLNKIKTRIVYTVFMILFWGTPFASFVFYRLYLHGYVRWW